MGTIYDKHIEKIKKNKVLVIVILIGMLVISLGDFSEAITKIGKLFGGDKPAESTKAENIINILDELFQKFENNSDKKNTEILSELQSEKDLLGHLGSFILTSHCTKEEIREFVNILRIIKSAKIINIQYSKSSADLKTKKLKTLKFALDLALSHMEDVKKFRDTPLYTNLFSILTQTKMTTEFELDALYTSALPKQSNN
jgi:hypothetical protein